MKTDLFASLRLLAATLLVCSLLYPVALWLFGQVVAPEAAEGSLVRAADGRVIGARRIAQAFSSPRYVWPRPSAVDWDASAAGGSNLSPANPKIAERARELLARPGMKLAGPVPAELVLASGSGLDPDLSEAAALYQAPRVAAARELAPERVSTLVRRLARPVAPGASERLVNVLELNLALDRALDGTSGGTLDRRSSGGRDSAGGP